MSEDKFDLCVVGAGLIGSAAAKYASAVPGIKVCVVGPPEPSERSISDKRDIYGAHYDEGRLVRAMQRNLPWTILAQKSIQRFRQLEQDSGVKFYDEVGHLTVGTQNSDFMQYNKKIVKERNVKADILVGGQLKQRFPFLNFSEKDEGVLETQNAGYISPRGLLQAQLKVAQKNGAALIRDVVSHVDRVVQSDGSYIMRVRTENGHKLLCKQVLLATGAFTTLRSVLPGLVPRVKLCPLTVAKVEVTEATAKRLSPFPPVCFDGIGNPDLDQKFPRSPNGTVSYYMLPPILYPNGKYYIKLGHFHDVVSKRLFTSEEVKTWFCEGNPNLAKDTADFICSLVKGTDMQSYHGDYCIIVETETDLPYIDMVHSQLGVAFGDNGHAAKSCDEIGRIAASMMLGQWDSEIPKETFCLRLKEDGVVASKL